MKHEEAPTKFHDPTPKPCCKHLRTKQMFYGEGERPGMLSWSNSTTTWCLKTNDCLGPDDGAALHPKCQPGRGCHESLT